jgi:outer membrane protein
VKLWLRCQLLDAQKQLEKLSGTYDSDYKKMVEEYQAKLKKYEAESATVTDVINGTDLKRFRICKKIVDFRDNAQKNYNKRI